MERDKYGRFTGTKLKNMSPEEKKNYIRNSVRKSREKLTEEEIKLRNEKAIKYYYTHKEEYKIRAKKNREKIRKQKPPRIILGVYNSKKKYREENPEKINARQIANRKIQIPEGTKCEVCKMNLATERHHTDYSKPLEVMLVCKDCHKKLNSQLITI